MTVDLRSDTMTRPTPGMLDAMHQAVVGDDVWEEDPTVKTLEHMLAARFGKEAGLFCPTGTMANQVALKTLTQPGQELLCDYTTHIYQYESGAYALLSGLSTKVLHGDRGRLSAAQIRPAINAHDIHKARTSVVCLENTCNKGGGSVYRLNTVQGIRQVCQENGMALYLDGARLFNALAVSGESEQDWGRAVDMLSIGLSKGLGCPAGTVLLGSNVQILQARRWRKVFGGGMRQVGYLAAAGLYALEHHVDRLSEDHRKARELANVVQQRPWCRELLPVETNIVLFHLDPAYNPDTFIVALESGGVQTIGMGGDLIRLVTHLDVDEQGLALALEVLQRIP